MATTVTKKGNKVVIEIDFDKDGKASASGKSIVHASTSGNQAVVVEGKQMYLGVNLYAKA